MGFAVIEIGIPRSLWMSEISRRYPGSTFTVLSCFPLGMTECLICVRVEGDHGIIGEIESHPSVAGVSTLFSSEEKCVLVVKTRFALPLFVLLKSELIVQPPVHIRNGTARLNLVHSPGRLKVFTLLMKMLGLPFKLVKVTTRYEEERLTKRQKEILEHAIRHGYYDTPRKTTIRELARKLNISKSTLSEILRTIENKMIKAGHVREK
jgi:DNA-binding CsgD family transcriptional regulator